MRNHVSGQVDHTVTLGQDGYGNALTVTPTGAIVPAYSALPQAGAYGIDIAAGVASAHILNQGSVEGARGSYAGGQGGYAYGYAGGVGINFSAAGRLVNQGNVTGGAGGMAAYRSGNGGIGVHLGSNVMLANTGLVSGGAGGFCYGGDGGNGGAGVVGDGADRVSNSGTIQGGSASPYSGETPYASGLPYGVGGTGVQLGDASRLTNTGLIQGGDGGAAGLDHNRVNDVGGIGVELGGRAVLVNGGTIVGGTGGAPNYGNYFVPTAAGGAGVLIDATGLVINTGQITGGQQPAGYAGDGQPGAIGVNVGAGTLNNSGGITGGNGYLGGYGPGTPGGAGVTLSGGHVTNSGTITGGVGYSGPYSPGGAGVSESSGSVSNRGLIIGGMGGGGGASGHFFAVSAGGTGVALDGGTLANTGTIIGGQGDTARGAEATAGAGGVGAALSGGVLTNAGLIQGGLGGLGLVGYPGNTFAGSGIGGLGLALGSGERLVDSGTVQGGTGGAGQYGGNGGTGVSIDGGTLVVSGTVSGGQGGVGQNSTGNMGEAVQFGSLGGTLAVDPGAVLKGDIAGNEAASDTLELAGTAAASLSGFGDRITGLTNIAEDAHATWTLTGSMFGTGAISIGAGAQLTLNGPVSAASIQFISGGDEKLLLGSPGGIPTPIPGTFSGFAAGDLIDFTNLSIYSYKYANGTLTLEENRGTLVLHFAGPLTNANFALKSDGYSGTDIVFRQSPSNPTAPATSSTLSAAREVSFVDHFASGVFEHLRV